MRLDRISELAALVVLIGSVFTLFVKIDSLATKKDLARADIKIHISIVTRQLEFFTAKSDLGYELTPLEKAHKHQLVMELEDLKRQQIMLAYKD